MNLQALGFAFGMLFMVFFGTFIFCGAGWLVSIIFNITDPSEAMLWVLSPIAFVGFIWCMYDYANG